MQVQVDALDQSTAPTVYISTLDHSPDEVKADLSASDIVDKETARAEHELLRSFGWFEDLTKDGKDVAFVDALTPNAMHAAVAALGGRKTRTALAVLSGHGKRNDHKILFSDERYEQAKPETETTWASRITGNVDVLFLSTCNSATALISLRNVLPIEVQNELVLIGAKNTLTAARAAHAALALHHFATAGYDIAKHPEKLQLPGDNFRILVPGRSAPLTVSSYSRPGTTFLQSTNKYIDGLRSMAR